MRRTAPGELIDFRAAIQDPHDDPDENSQEPLTVALKPIDPGLSATQRKKQEKGFELLRLRMKEALERSDESKDLVYIEPVEDEVFDQGMAWLDPQVGSPQAFLATLNIHPNVWHSSTRRSIP